MAKETEYGRRSPSIIARLMGFEGLPASHNINKKQKKLSDNCQRGSSSSSFSNDSKFHETRSHKNCGIGRQSFKDVYEVKDRSHKETRSSSSLTSSNLSYREDEIGFMREKFMDAKPLFTDGNFQHSKEFHDNEVLSSNKDLFLRFLQEPDSLFSKHLNDLYLFPKSYYSNLVGMNSNNTGEASQKIDISHSRKHRTNCHSNMYDRHSKDLYKHKISVEGNKNASSNPTKIVLLKPNLGKAFNVTKSTPSDLEFTPEHSVVELRNKRSKDNDSDSYCKKSRESRELAREITCRMKSKLGRDSFYFSSSGNKGYSADESSHDTSENDSSYESEITIHSSRTSSNRKLHNKSSSLYMESSVNMEAKKRLSERWKMTHRSREIGESSKGSTLAEMLATPELDIRSPSLDATFGKYDGISGMFSPSGISSRDGWKNGYIQNLSRSRSLPNSSNHIMSPKSNSKCEAITPEKFLVRKENVGHARNKPIKRDFRRKDESFVKNKKSSDEKYWSFCPVEVVDEICEVQANGNSMKNIVDGKDSPEVKNVILEIPSSGQDMCLPINEDIRAQESHSCVLPQDESSSSGLPSLPQVGGSSYLQCTATHLESPSSSKEAEQPSPISVLEAPFVEDSSSGSECFERVSADLNGLRMQLQLLKQESKRNDEEAILISNDDYVDESTELYDDDYFTLLPEQSWESQYLVDLLTLSGLDKLDSEFFLSAWHSPDCPISPRVFEDLENKYNELDSCSRPERKLLYDIVNARIMEMGQRFIDTEPWVKKQGKYIQKWSKDVLKIELKKLVEKYEKKPTEKELDEMRVENMGWMNIEEHISSIGREIEALLIDELVLEAIFM